MSVRQNLMILKIRLTIVTVRILGNLEAAPEEALQLRGLIKGSNWSFGHYLFGRYEFWKFWHPIAQIPPHEPPLGIWAMGGQNFQNSYLPYRWCPKLQFEPLISPLSWIASSGAASRLPRIMTVTIVRRIFKIVNFCPTNM